MTNDTKSRKHRPSQVARLKKQLQQARTDEDAARKESVECTLFLYNTGQIAAFNQWIKGREVKDGAHAMARVMDAARQEAENAKARLDDFQAMHRTQVELTKTYQAEAASLMERVKELMNIITRLTFENATQREKVVQLTNVLARH